MEAWKAKDLVSAGLYADERAVIQDASRPLGPSKAAEHEGIALGLILLKSHHQGMPCSNLN
jgi:hypothetical protein